ncbi:MAG: hypothetical protein JNL18_02360 [Planctomycetaceae bacterium]|nr:hypothetical protein [Planctomycetaceae bacterium]
MREPREPATTDQYERPQQAWTCGLAANGAPCPAGPTSRGSCPAAAACHPVRDGDRWHCNRSTLRGGPCDEGPSPDGECCTLYRCTPVRSLRVRRGRFVIGIAVAALGALVMALSGSWRNEFLAPGPLSAHHAQLLEGKNATQRCAQCHAAGLAAVGTWWERSLGGAELSPTQSLLCLECHRDAIGQEFAMAAHGVELASLEELTRVRMERVSAGGGDARARWGERRRNPGEPIACAACHREHQGRMHDLAAVTNVGCQACHRQEFESFADGHPEFGGWPHLRRTRIAFDHAAHQLKHFPEEKRDFACAACHQADPTGQRQLTASFADSCAACHDKSIAASFADGVMFLSLPTLDVESLADHDIRLTPWPAAATGDFEGAPSLFAKLLMQADADGAAALGVLGADFDLYDVDIEDATQLRAAAQAAESLRAIVNELADQGEPAIAARLKTLLGREPAAKELASLSGRLSTQGMKALRDEWFGDTGSATPNNATAGDENESPSPGSWKFDQNSLALRYRPSGHADPWLRAWLDVLAEGASGPHAKLIEPLLQQAMKPTAPGQCGSCHSLDRIDGRYVIQWEPLDVAREPRGFTRFNHAPHIVQPRTGDCASCHQVSVGADFMASYAERDPHRFTSGFAPMSKAACAACHTAAAAGDSCTQCHRYHK